MKRLLLAAVLFSFCFESFSQIYRYAEPLFPTSDITTNVIYGTAPFLNSLYTDENNTTVGDLVMDLYEGTGDTCANRPAIIFVHGGGFITGNRNHNDMVAFWDSFATKG
jgi:acetyl esterase/lipase